MQTLTVGIAPINRPQFKPVHAKVPVSDKVLANALTDPTTAQNLWNAVRILLGVPLDALCVQGIVRADQTIIEFDSWLSCEHIMARAKLGFSQPTAVNALAVII